MEHQEYAKLAEREEIHWWHVSRRRILAGLIGRLGLPKPAQILEVGCGPGGNLAMLAQFGALSAIEFDDSARELAAKRSGVPVKAACLPELLPFEPSAFDLVVAFDVIEHIDDDHGSVKTLHRYVKPGGWFVSTVPAYQWMWSDHDVLLHHKRRYTLRPYATMIEAAGFQIRKKSYFNTYLFPVAAGVRAAQKLLGKSGAAERELPSPRSNRILTKIFSAEAPVLRVVSFPFGLSILVAAQRPNGTGVSRP